MKPVKSLSIILGAIVFIAVFGGQSRAEFPEYDANQNSGPTIRLSGICTSDGKFILDGEFAQMVKNALINAQGQKNYAETAFAFMECYGGGMIDQLTYSVGTSSDVSSFTSASRYYELAWYGPIGGTTGNLSESYYNFPYAQRAGGTDVNTHAEAAEYGYNKDLVGPVVNNPLKEHPQYKFTYEGTDKTDVTLYRTNQGGGDTPDKYRAILFGGSVIYSAVEPDAWANYNSLSRIYSNLKARGYDDSEIYLMYPDPAKKMPDGITPLPDDWVVDDGTTYQDMKDAWNWMKNQTDANTQVYYWSNICHGMALEGIQYPNPGTINLTVDFINYVISGEPDFLVIAPDLLADLAVVLNNEPLAFLSVADHTATGTGYLYKFALDANDIANLQTNNSVGIFNFRTGEPVVFTMAGITTGNMSQNYIPEPATLVLFAIAGLLIRRK